MNSNFDNFNDKMNGKDALKDELQELKNKILMGRLTEEEQLTYLEAYMIPFARKLGVDLTIEEMKQYIKLQNDFDEIPKDTEANAIQMKTAGDFMHQFFDDDKNNRKE